MQKNFYALLLVISLLLPLEMRAQGTLYVSNLGQTTVAGAPIGSDSWQAQLFYTGTNSGGYSLDSVQLRMNGASGSPSGFDIALYSVNSNTFIPVSNLGSLVGAGAANPGISTYTASGITLLPSTEYFIVLTSSTPIALGAYEWQATSADDVNNQSAIPPWVIQANHAFSVDGSNWTDFSPGIVFKMAIYATPIPEPSSLALLGLSGLLMSLGGAFLSKSSKIRS